MILTPFSFVVKLKVKVDAQSVLLKLADQLIMNGNYTIIFIIIKNDCYH